MRRKPDVARAQWAGRLFVSVMHDGGLRRYQRAARDVEGAERRLDVVKEQARRCPDGGRVTRAPEDGATELARGRDQLA